MRKERAGERGLGGPAGSEIGVSRAEKNTARAACAPPLHQHQGENHDKCHRDPESADGRHEARGRPHPCLRCLSRQPLLPPPWPEPRCPPPLRVLIPPLPLTPPP